MGRSELVEGIASYILDNPYWVLRFEKIVPATWSGAVSRLEQIAKGAALFQDEVEFMFMVKTSIDKTDGGMKNGIH